MSAETMARVGRRYEGVRVAVFGGTGFIGQWTARALASFGADVHLIVRDVDTARAQLAASATKATIVKTDLATPGAARATLESIRPSVTFNLAGYGADRAERTDSMAERINADLPGEIANSVAGIRDDRWQGTDFVHVGSALEYGTLSGHLNEDETPNPTTVYGRTKLAGTLAVSDACRSAGIHGVTARLFHVYGPGGHTGRLLPSLIAASRSEETLALTHCEQRLDFAFVQEVAEGLLRLGVVRSDTTVVNFATGRLLRVREFVETAARLLGIPPQRLAFGAVPARTEDMHHEPVDVRRLKHLLDWLPTMGIEDGIRKSFEITFAGDSRP